MRVSVRGHVRVRRTRNMDDSVAAARSPPTSDGHVRAAGIIGLQFSRIFFSFELCLFEACTELYVNATTIARTF